MYIREPQAENPVVSRILPLFYRADRRISFWFLTEILSRAPAGLAH